MNFTQRRVHADVDAYADLNADADAYTDDADAYTEDTDVYADAYADADGIEEGDANADIYADADVEEDEE